MSDQFDNLPDTSDIKNSNKTSDLNMMIFQDDT